MNQPSEDYDKEFLRENWRFSTIVYFLELFGFACPHPIPSLTPNVLENALLEVINKRDPKKGTKKETSKNPKTTTVSLEDIFVALLRGMYPKKDLGKDQWETVLRNKMKHDYKYFQNFLDLSLYEQPSEQTTTTMTSTTTPTAQSSSSEISNTNSILSNPSVSTQVGDFIIQDSNNSNSSAQEITFKTSTTNKTENTNNNKSNGNNETTNINKNMHSSITQVSQNTMTDTTADYPLLSALGTRNNTNTTLEKSKAAKKQIHDNNNEESDSDYINDSDDDEQEREQEDGGVESDESETVNKNKRKKATIDADFYRRSDRLNPRGKKEEVKEKKNEVQESDSEDEEESGKSKTKNTNGKFSHPLFTLPVTSLPFPIKILILQFLCESQIDLNDDIKKMIEIRNSEGVVGAKTLRKEEYAIDGRGMIYWFFGGDDEVRLCREHQKSVDGDLFQTVATDHDSLEKFVETLSSSKNKKDMDLVEKLQQNIIQPHNARLQVREAAAKRLKRLSINPGNILTSSSRTSARERPRPNYSNFFAD